jgi:hypothetical protein
MYFCVVLKSECPAIRMIASGDIPAAAAFVIPVCRQSWNSRIGRSDALDLAVLEGAAEEFRKSILRLAPDQD